MSTRNPQGVRCSLHSEAEMEAAAKALEKATLDAAVQEMWARLPADHQWLRDWRLV